MKKTRTASLFHMATSATMKRTPPVIRMVAFSFGNHQSDRLFSDTEEQTKLTEAELKERQEKFNRMRKKRLRKLVVYHEGPLYDADSEETDNLENGHNSETNNQPQQDNEADRFDWEGVHYLLEVGYMKFANKVKTGGEQISMKFDLILQAVDYVVIKFILADEIQNLGKYFFI